MGIERFFRSIEQNNITNFQDNFTYKLEKIIKTDYLLIDFNSIIHITSSQIVSDLNFILYNLIKKTPNKIKLQKLFEEYVVREDIDINSFKSYFTIDKINKLIINKTEKYLMNMVTNFINSEQLKHLFIAADGVANKSKILEQRKRRYMGTIINSVKEKLFEIHKKDIFKVDKNRYLFEINKISWNKIYITPGTLFIEQLNDRLNGDQFKENLQIICPNLQSYLFSDSSEIGEGEKKIVDYLRNLHHSNDLENNYFFTIYSPDSDVSLLGLLLNTYHPFYKNQFNNLNLIRFNQQANNYDIVDIDILSKNIFNYVNSNIEVKLSLEQKDMVINDIVFILTIFGNDFLPKIVSFNVKYDFDRIIDKYCKMLKDNYQFILKYSLEDGRYILNQNTFTKLIKELQVDEGGNLQKMYMISNYQNYDKLKKLLGATQSNFTQVINDFLEKLRKFNHEIMKGELNIVLWLKEKDFLDKLMKLARLNINYETIKDNYEQFIKEYNNFYKLNRKIPKINITFRKYARSLDNEFHMMKLEKIIDSIDPDLIITNFDKEIYKFDNMLDEYKQRLNHQPLDLGLVFIDPKTYTWKSEKIQKSVKNYYNQSFGVTDISIDNHKMFKLLSSYIEGFIWVMNYYYNLQFHQENADVWFYQYNNAPLLTQLYYFMKNKNKEPNYLLNLELSLDQYKVNVENFFNQIENLFYVTPIKYFYDKLELKYKKFVNDYPNYFIDIDPIVDSILYEKNSDEIDCMGALFLNKCEIKALIIQENVMDSHKKDLKFINDLRVIENEDTTVGV